MSRTKNEAHLLVMFIVCSKSHIHLKARLSFKIQLQFRCGKEKYNCAVDNTSKVTEEKPFSYFELHKQLKTRSNSTSQIPKEL